MSPTGDDVTGDGSYAAPFQTIARAAAVAVLSPVDAIEVFGGTVAETSPIGNVSGFKMLRGRGADRTFVTLTGGGGWLAVDSTDALSLVVADLTIAPTDDTEVLDVVASDDTACNVTFVRCRLALNVDSIAIRYTGPDPQDFVPRTTADLLHCVVEGPIGERSGVFLYGVGSPSRAVAVRNTIFRRLQAVVIESSQPFDSDGNCFFGNERDLTIGAYGPSDLRDVDPMLVGTTTRPAQEAQIAGKGADLSDGYGSPPRATPSEVGTLPNGASPTIGISEIFSPSARTTVVTTDVHAILTALAGEAQLRREDLSQIERDRSMPTASGVELSRRFGAAFGIRFVQGGDVEAYRTVLEEISSAILHHAPTWRALRRAAQVIFGRLSPLRRTDFFRTYHCKAGASLKLWADASSGLPPFKFYLSPGEILLEDRWIPVRKATFSVAHADNTWTVYVDGSAPYDANDEAIVHVTSSPIADESLVALPGLLTFRRGETKVAATLALPATVQQHRRVATGFFASDYVVESIADDRKSLTLRYPFPEEDHVGLAWVVVPNAIFGTVQIDAALGILKIVCPGRVGRGTTRPLTAATRGHGYKLVLNADGTVFVTASPLAISLFEILGRMHPFPKLGYFKFRDDEHSLVLGQPWPFSHQSSLDYAEIFDDPTWFGI